MHSSQTNSIGRHQIIQAVRALLPPRALDETEARSVAERQAQRLSQLLDLAAPIVDLDAVAGLPRLDVHTKAGLPVSVLLGVEPRPLGHRPQPGRPSDQTALHPRSRTEARARQPVHRDAVPRPKRQAVRPAGRGHLRLLRRLPAHAPTGRQDGLGPGSPARR